MKPHYVIGAVGHLTLKDMFSGLSPDRRPNSDKVKETGVLNIRDPTRSGDLIVRSIPHLHTSSVANPETDPHMLQGSQKAYIY